MIPSTKPRRRCLALTLAALAVWGWLATGQAQPAARAELWLKPPSLGIMAGFIYEPRKPYPIQEWIEKLGHRWDADQWVEQFQEAGASYLVFYDKWIDGLVFHDTRTTGFKTRRDFVREIAGACHRRGLRLVYYFNAVSDGNPEFDAWSLRDPQGQPIVFSPEWPTRYQTLHSPFHEKAVAQLRELFSGYGRVDGIWLDIFGERLNTSSDWVARGFQRQYGEPFAKASPARLADFNARTLGGFLDEVQALARDLGQSNCLWTANGAAGNFLQSGVWTSRVGSRLDYGSDEGHTFPANDRLARMAWVLPKPMDICYLLNSSWFTPLADPPPPSHLSAAQAIAGTAIGICQGASVYFALTPGHGGELGEDLQRAKAAGAWFRQVQPFVAQAGPYADFAIILGTPAASGAGFPPVLWKNKPPGQSDAITHALAMQDALRREGIFCRILYAWENQGSWQEPLSRFRKVILPEQAPLDSEHAEALRRYVREGGTLIAFGQGSRLTADGQWQPDYALADVLGARYLGETAFPDATPLARVRADSDYSPGYAAANLLDGLPTAWASDGSPMPHWVEITLPMAVEIESVELINREQEYQVADVDLEWPDGEKWRLAKSVRDAVTRRVVIPCSPPIKTGRIRIKILRELYQGRDRQYADLEGIRVLDKAGLDWAGCKPRMVSARHILPEFERLAGGLSFAPWAVAVQPTTAKAVAHWDAAGQEPAILTNQFGRGTAWLVTASDTAQGENPGFWRNFRTWLNEAGTISMSVEDARRYHPILTQVGEDHVLHLIDAQVPGTNYQPKGVLVSLRAGRLGGIRQVRLIGPGTPLEFSSQKDEIKFLIEPNPVASVLLQNTRQ